MFAILELFREESLNLVACVASKRDGEGPGLSISKLEKTSIKCPILSAIDDN